MHTCNLTSSVVCSSYPLDPSICVRTMRLILWDAESLVRAQCSARSLAAAYMLSRAPGNAAKARYRSSRFKTQTSKLVRAYRCGESSAEEPLTS